MFRATIPGQVRGLLRYHQRLQGKEQVFSRVPREGGEAGRGGALTYWRSVLTASAPAPVPASPAGRCAGACPCSAAGAGAREPGPPAAQQLQQPAGPSASEPAGRRERRRDRGERDRVQTGVTGGCPGPETTSVFNSRQNSPSGAKGAPGLGIGEKWPQEAWSLALEVSLCVPGEGCGVSLTYGVLGAPGGGGLFLVRISGTERKHGGRWGVILSGTQPEETESQGTDHVHAYAILALSGGYRGLCRGF